MCGYYLIYASMSERLLSDVVLLKEAYLPEFLRRCIVRLRILRRVCSRSVTAKKLRTLIWFIFESCWHPSHTVILFTFYHCIVHI